MFNEAPIAPTGYGGGEGGREGAEDLTERSNTGSLFLRGNRVRGSWVLLSHAWGGGAERMRFRTCRFVFNDRILPVMQGEGGSKPDGAIEGGARGREHLPHHLPTLSPLSL